MVKKPTNRPINQGSLLLSTQTMHCLHCYKGNLSKLPYICIYFTHLANGPGNKSLNFIFPTEYVTPKSSKG